MASSRCHRLIFVIQTPMKIQYTMWIAQRHCILSFHTTYDHAQLISINRLYSVKFLWDYSVLNNLNENEPKHKQNCKIHGYKRIKIIQLCNYPHRYIRISPAWLTYSSVRIKTSSKGTLSTLRSLCWGNPPVTRGCPSQRPVTRSFYVFLELCLKKRWSKQSRRRWFHTPSRSLWRHCNGE